MFRYSINNLTKLNNKQFKSCFTTIKNINKNAFINQSKSFKFTTTTTTTSTTSTLNNFKSLFNNSNFRFYSNNHNNNSNNSNNNESSSNENNNKNHSNNNNSSNNSNNDINEPGFLNRNKKRILYSMGIVGLGLFSSFGGTGNNNNNGDIKTNYYNIYGFRISESNLVIGSIMAVNLVIFALLNRPQFFNRFGESFFCSIPSVYSHPQSIILSTFSHTELFHFGFNMYALYNFGSVCYDNMGFRDFMLLYLFGGLVGTMSSLTFKLVTGSVVPSIGASGSILSIVGASVFFEKGMRLGIILTPWSFEPLSFVMALLAFDLAGMLIRPLARVTGFDHACHLGSALFGLSIGSCYQYKSRFENFDGSGKILNHNYTYTGTIKNGDFNGFGQFKNSKYIQHGMFKDGAFVSGEVTHLASGQKKLYQRRNPPQ